MRVVSFAQDIIYDVTSFKVLNPERVGLDVLLSNLTVSTLQSVWRNFSSSTETVRLLSSTSRPTRSGFNTLKLVTS
jgi:hypothetical protein